MKVKCEDGDVGYDELLGVVMDGICVKTQGKKQ